MRYDSDLLYRPPGEWQQLSAPVHHRVFPQQMHLLRHVQGEEVSDPPGGGDPGGHRHGPRTTTGPMCERVFLMDGDAIVMRTERAAPDPGASCMLPSLSSGEGDHLRRPQEHPEPRRRRNCSALREAGLTRAYLGVESGSDAVLQAIQKGCHRRSRCCRRARTAGGGGHRPVGHRHPGPHRAGGGRLGGAHPVHRRHHQQNEAPPPVRHDLCPCQGHPAGGGRAGRALSGVLPRTRSWRSATCCWSTWMWTPSTSPATTPPTTCP